MKISCFVAAVLLLTIPPPLQAETDYADPKSCAECHGELCESWAKSDHAKSMDHAAEVTVLGDFDDKHFLYPFTGSKLGFDLGRRNCYA